MIGIHIGGSTGGGGTGGHSCGGSGSAGCTAGIGRCEELEGSEVPEDSADT
jgi:hypothetical protein